MNVETEVWKDINGYPNYQVSNIGRIRSLRFGKEKIRKLRNVHGYLNVDLYNSKEHKSFQIHRLVAQAFIPNPENLPIINHKNEIRNDNRVENLEWCTYKYNNNYGTSRQKNQRL